MWRVFYWGFCVKLSALCIKRPVFATVLSLIIIILGIVGLSSLGIRFFPKMTVPQVTIRTYYQGADPQTIESSITTPLESAISGVEGIDNFTSKSSTSWSTITIQFKLGSNFEDEVSQVRDKVFAARKNLPTDSDLPTISTGGNNGAVLNIGIIDPNKTSAEIRDYAVRYLMPPLRQVDGVGGVGVDGASDYAMRIWLNAGKMATLGVTVTDVETALSSNNIQFPAGAVRDPNRHFTIVSRTKLDNPQQFNQIVVRKTAGRLIRFSDFATVKVGSRSFQDAPMRINGQNGIVLNVEPLKSANPIAVASRAKQVLTRLVKHLPKGMKVQVIFDQSLFLKSALWETAKAILEAIALVVFVVYLFLGSLRASSIPIVTIPVCVIGVFGVMMFLGFTINVMTLLAIVLAIGLVVDDAFVMLENIHRHIELGMTPMQAAFKGSDEIATAVIAMTITLAAVYAPIGLSQGFTAVLFKEFAFTLTAAVLLSGFVALTLSPMMCARLLDNHHQQPKSALSIWLDRRFDALSKAYQHSLMLILARRGKMLVILCVLIGVGIVFYQWLPKEFVPKEDVGVINVNVASPAGATIDYTERYMNQIQQLTTKIPAIQNYLTWIRSGSATSLIVLKPLADRGQSASDIIRQLTPKLSNITGVDATLSMLSPVSYGVNGSDFSIELLTLGDYKSLIKPMQLLVKKLKAYPGLLKVDHGLKFDNQQYALTINRDLAADVGVNIQDIADTAQVMLGGKHITDFLYAGKSYEVIVQMRKQDLTDFNGIKRLYVRSNNIDETSADVDNPLQNIVPLSSLIKLTPIVGQTSLNHYNRLRATWVSAQLAPGYTIGDAINYTRSVMPSILNEQTRYAFSGKAKQFIDSSGDMAKITLLAIVFIFLVLAAQFESFVDPMIILFTVPLSIVGALVTLKFSGGSLSLYSQIGLVTLVGLVSKHGILITQFANELRADGVPLKRAIVEAASIRLRPIMMTTAAMVLGSIPLALATGSGAEGRAQIGWVIVGGLIFGTFFSLVVVPVAYSYLAHTHHFKQEPIESRKENP